MVIHWPLAHYDRWAHGGKYDQVSPFPPVDGFAEGEPGGRWVFSIEKQEKEWESVLSDCLQLLSAAVTTLASHFASKHSY